MDWWDLNPRPAVISTTTTYATVPKTVNQQNQQQTSITFSFLFAALLIKKD
jgi:hypothetical protein